MTHEMIMYEILFHLRIVTLEISVEMVTTWDPSVAPGASERSNLANIYLYQSPFLRALGLQTICN